TDQSYGLRSGIPHGAGGHMRLKIVIVAVLALATVAVVTTVGATTASGKSGAGTPIVIGAAVDLTSSMKPFDSPALAGAQIEAAKIAAAGGPNFQIKVCNHQLKKQKSCAAQLEQQGAKVAIVTCDVEYAAPATQEFINHGLLTMSPCVTTDQMGPQRFGGKGKLAFTVGSTAQDEGSADAEYAYSRGWRTAIGGKDHLLGYLPKVTDYYVDNDASSFGDDPNPAVNALLKKLLAAKKVPYTASFVLGAATIDLLAAAYKKTGGSTDGAKLASVIEHFKNQPTISG